jgi:hypothetical protein
VHPDDVAAARRAASGLPGVAGLAESAGGVLALDGIAREAVPALVAALAAARVRVYRVAPHTPTLADAYFALQPPEARAPAAGASP